MRGGAAALGLDASRPRLVLLVFVTLLTGTAVAVAGSIGFIGLVVPNLTRLLVGADHRRAVAAAALLGALVLVWADTAAATWPTVHCPHCLVGNASRYCSRALAQQPRLLVLDEPTNHLDPRHQIAMLELAAALGITVLAALHSLDLAAQYANTVLVLNRGLVCCAGRPRDVFGPELLRDVFGVAGTLLDDPATGAVRLLLRPL
ncbi:iron chelate uptake ABC transporter family permease subunit [Saccharopolyspora sp. 5N708]|uniref:iron chelate uptake ABC transporter family permease subunit n=1 Tax=Saccharopolyspora sp. 5N708 TaxID=3457424 RepID=UPI003FD56AB1